MVVMSSNVNSGEKDTQQPQPRKGVEILAAAKGSVATGKVIDRPVVIQNSMAVANEPSSKDNLVGMASIEDIVAWMDNFAKLKSRVILQNPAYYTKLMLRGKEKVLINRSGWRAIQLAFNINDDIDKEETIQHSDGKNYTIRIWVRAWHVKSGRHVIGVGSCSTDEPGKVFQHPHHDVCATAHTRAKNRAISDLVGAGEVSAEEISPSGGSDMGPLNSDGGYVPKNDAERLAWEKARNMGRR